MSSVTCSTHGSGPWPEVPRPDGYGGTRAAGVRHALVVDDEALIRWSVAETLTGLGLDVEQAGDGATALRAVEAAAVAFDVVVLDLRLPDVSDLTLLEELRRRLPTATIVLMTAFGSAEIVARVERLGVRGVLDKPFELTDLVDLVGPAGRGPVS